MKSVALQNKRTSVLLKSLTLLLVFAFSMSSFSQEMDLARQKEGRKLFRSLCASCHKLDKKLVGPALGGVEERRENSWLKSWIKNNAEFQKVNAEAAEAALYSTSAMNAFPQLTDVNIDDILYYTTVGEIKKVPAAGETTIGGNVVVDGGAPSWVIYFLAAAIIVAFLMIASLLKQVNELKGKKKPEIQSNFKRDLQELWAGVKKNTFLKAL
ncbi:MAG TPA: cytochrome C, partial [Polaribacter sp.]|nr:cytochrome C [Polaribacter sp.]